MNKPKRTTKQQETEQVKNKGGRPPLGDDKKQTLCIRFAPAVLQKLEAKADKTGETRTMIIERAVKKALGMKVDK